MKSVRKCVWIAGTFCLTALLGFGCSEEILKKFLGEGDNVAGLKEALTIGAKNATTMLGKENGYLNDPTVFIDLPPEAKTTIKVASEVTSTLNTITSLPIVGSEIQNVLQENGINLGALKSDLKNELITAFNRGAEEAAPQAVDIFVTAITGITFTDATGILFSAQNDAATSYLKTATLTSLTAAFSPIINKSIEKINVKIGNDNYNALTAWSFYAEQNNKLSDLIHSPKFGTILSGAKLFLNDSQVNTINSIQTVNTDLGGYVVGKALGGIFLKVGNEEEKIRTDVSARVTPLLRDVFGQLNK